MRHELQPRQASRYARIAALVAAMGVGLWTQLGRGVAQPAAGHHSLRQIAEFDLPGPPGKRLDYLTIDDDDNYLLSAHLGAGLLHVIDLRTNAVVKTVPRRARRRRRRVHRRWQEGLHRELEQLL